MRALGVQRVGRDDGVLDVQAIQITRRRITPRRTLPTPCSGFPGAKPGKPPGYWPIWPAAQPSFSGTFSGTDELWAARSAAWAELTPARVISSDG